jgi:hypothetical protein
VLLSVDAGELLLAQELAGGHDELNRLLGRPERNVRETVEVSCGPSVLTNLLVFPDEGAVNASKPGERLRIPLLVVEEVQQFFDLFDRLLELGVVGVRVGRMLE